MYTIKHNYKIGNNDYSLKLRFSNSLMIIVFSYVLAISFKRVITTPEFFYYSF